MPVDVVFVEDLANVQAAMVDMLLGLGDYRVAAKLPTEAEALAWFDANPNGWGLAVIDLVLAQGSGMGVVARARKTSPNGKVVVFSSFVTETIRNHCIRLGADAAFDKNSQLSQFADFCAELAPHPPPTL